MSSTIASAACISLFAALAISAEVRSQPSMQPALAIDLRAGDGWTVFVPSSDTRTIYVSSSTGNDANNGLSTSVPKQTIAAGKALLRQGFPDWLLLRRGDVWQESLGHWATSGRSLQEPQLIGSYGPDAARPLLRTGVGHGLNVTTGGNSPPRIDHLALVGIHFHAHTHSGGPIEPVGLRFVHTGQNYLVEDCFVQGYHVNVVIQGYGGRFSSFRLRRSVIADAFTTNASHSQGLFAWNVDGLLIDENVFDHNGWNELVPGAIANVYRHSLYLQNGCTNAVVQRNIIANSASHGLQLRCGGIANDNLFLRNSISLQLGGGVEPKPQGVVVEARRNVILDGKNIDSANPRGWGMTIANITAGTVTHNVIANQTLGQMPSVISVEGSANGRGVHNTLFEKNVFSNWGGSMIIYGNTAQITNLTLRNNDFQNRVSGHFLIEHVDAATTASVTSGGNRFYSASAPMNSWARIGPTATSIDTWRLRVNDSTSTAQAVVYPNPSVSVASYNAALQGQATYQAFINEVRKQSRTNWRPAYTALAVNLYVRSALGLSVN